MKKIAIASLIALAAVSASAMELGVTAARDFAGDNRNAYGVTLGKKFGPVGVTAGFDRAWTTTNDQTRYSLTAGYDVAKFGPVTVTPKAGVAYIDNQFGADGYAMSFGVGASLPLTKQVSLTADVARQYGQDRVNQFDGNRVTVGVNYKF